MAPSFPRRAVFGDYVGAQVAPLIATGAVEHRRAKVAAIRQSAGGWRIETSSGEILAADVVVLAATHPSPAAPPVLAALRGHPGYRPDPTAPGGLAGIAPDAEVLIVGSG